MFLLICSAYLFDVIRLCTTVFLCLFAVDRISFSVFAQLGPPPRSVFKRFNVRQRKMDDSIGCRSKGLSFPGRKKITRGALPTFFVLTKGRHTSRDSGCVFLFLFYFLCLPHTMRYKHNKKENK